MLLSLDVFAQARAAQTRALGLEYEPSNDTRKHQRTGTNVRETAVAQ
jgi:hypothetical protein